MHQKQVFARGRPSLVAAPSGGLTWKWFTLPEASKARSSVKAATPPQVRSTFFPSRPRQPSHSWRYLQVLLTALRRICSARPHNMRHRWTEWSWWTCWWVHFIRRPGWSWSLATKPRPPSGIEQSTSCRLSMMWESVSFPKQLMCAP